MDNRVLLACKIFFVWLLSLYFCIDIFFDIIGLLYVTVWLLILFLHSAFTRITIGKPVQDYSHRYIWLPLFPLFLFTSTACFLPGSLPFLSIIAREGLMAPPGKASVKAGINILVIAMPLLLYIHYSILSFDASDERGLWERFRTVTGLGGVIDAYREDEGRRGCVSAVKSGKRLIIVVLLACSGYMAYDHLYHSASGDRNINMRKLTSMYFDDAHRLLLLVGDNRQLFLAGKFSDKSEHYISEPEYGTKYSSSNPAVVSITGSSLNALSSGDAVITAENRGFTAQMHVVVFDDTTALIKYRSKNSQNK
jgi:hypothetical protein